MRFPLGLIARPLVNAGVAVALFLTGWGVTALPTPQTLGWGVLLGAIGAFFVFCAAVSMLLALVGIVYRRVRS
jgi:hypothetical protein